MFWLTIALIWMGGTDFAGCSGCQELCLHAQMETSTAYLEWQAAEEAHQTAVSNGEDQQTLDQLDAERMQAQVNHQNAVQSMETICGG